MSNRLFNSISSRRPKRNVFDLSHDYKLSCNMSDLIPVLCQEVVPGDKFQVNTNAFVRLSPMLAPVMHSMNVYMHYFFVPNRILWDEWEDFITGGRTGTSEPVFPRVKINGVYWRQFQKGTLADYLGIGVGNTPPSSSSVDAEVSLLPFRAYSRIYDEFYRDQNLMAQDEAMLRTNSGVISPSSAEWSAVNQIRKRAWEKDYFTSALPWTQRGAEATIPLNLSGQADVKLKSIAETGGDAGLLRRADRQPLDETWAGKTLNTSSNAAGTEGSASYFGPALTGSPQPTRQVVYDPNNTLYADLSQGESTSGIKVNELRRSIRLQEWLEKNARGGARYIEQLLSHFGVAPTDARLQRPEFLGGGRTPIVISEVLQTSSTDTESPQGNMAGHGISAGASNTFRKTFEEHGLIIGIMSILPRTAYQQGLPRMFAKFDKFDYYFPSFAHLGEQEIWNKELYFDPSGSNNGTFGYTPRYAEYKYMPSRVSGDFKDNLSFWHMGRIFDQRPNLSNTFVQSNPINRIFAVQDNDVDHFWIQLHHNIKAIRPMPKYGTPTI